MPQQVINVYDRPTYQTEKVKGWDITRMLKATALTSSAQPEEFNVPQGGYIIRNFTQNYGSNYKGTNFVRLDKFENFDSIKIKMNGLYKDEENAWFNFYLYFLDQNYSSVIDQITSNYTEKLDNLPRSDKWRDWYLELELTFYLDDEQNYCFVVNGNYTIALDNEVNRGDVRLIPFNGQVNLANQGKIAIDLMPYNGGNSAYSIKSVSMEFVE
jgi:hypothetical protein